MFQSLTQADRDRLKDEFMNEFDENRDGRIEMHEVRICDFSKNIYIFIRLQYILITECLLIYFGSINSSSFDKILILFVV